MAFTSASSMVANRKIPASLGLRLVGILDGKFLQVVPLNVTDCLAENDGQRAAELLLLKLITARPIGNPNDINLGGWKNVVRPVIEKLQAYILWRLNTSRERGLGSRLSANLVSSPVDS